MSVDNENSILDILDTGPQLAGKQIAHYTIVKELGRGGMGVVYRAIDTKLNRPVAIKFLAPGTHRLETSRDRFIREAQSASSINHPNICTVYEINEWEGRVFIVMEYVDGQTLSEVIARDMSVLGGKTTTDVHRAIDIGIQIATGLTKAHEKQVIHRDIKPDNIMVTRDGLVKIMDFGLAKLAGETRLTNSRSTVGTVGFMSPEQIQGMGVDHRSDIFSLGVVLYEMLAGRLPFVGDHEAALIYEILNVDPPSLLETCKGVDTELNALVFKCLAKKPENRYQAMGDLLADLRKYEPASLGKVIVHESLSSARLEQYRNIGARVFSNFDGRKRKLPASSRNVLTVGLLVFIAAIAVFVVTKVPSSGNALLSVSTEPPGAAITLDGDIMGVTPLLNQKVESGNLGIRAQCDGYLAIDTSVVLRKGEIRRIFLEMTRIPAGQVASTPPSRDKTDNPPTRRRTGPSKPVTNLRTVSEVCTALAQMFKGHVPAHGHKVLLLPFTIRGTQVTSAFSLLLRKELQSALSSLAGWNVTELYYTGPVSDDIQGDLARASGARYVFSGYYWQDPDDAGFSARLADVASGEEISSATIPVDGSSFVWGKVNKRPDNFEMAAKKESELTKGEIGSNNELKVDIWTNKGTKNLLFVKGDTLKLYVRVNMDCHLRLLDVMPDGRTVVIIEDSLFKAKDLAGTRPFSNYECDEPFGVEILQVFVRSEKFQPVKTRQEGKYRILAEDLGEAVAATRGLKQISERLLLQSEARLVITTALADTTKTAERE